MSEKFESSHPRYIKTVDNNHQELMHTPSLRGIFKTLNLTHSLIGPDVQSIPGASVKELFTQVSPFNNAVEFSDNVREETRRFVHERLPLIKSDVPRFSQIPDAILLDSLTHGWFEEAVPYLGKRSEILLLVYAHAVKRIETKIIRDTLHKADPGTLHKLGLNRTTSALAQELLSISLRTDALYIRFKAFTQLIPSPRLHANEVTFDFAGKYVTTRSLFPKESLFLANNLTRLARKVTLWQKMPNADILRKYLQTLARFYKERDPAQAQMRQEEIEKLYVKLIKSKFPLVVVPTINESEKSPFYEPQIRICLRSHDTRTETQDYYKARESLVRSLGDLDKDAHNHAPNLAIQPIESLVTLGAYGANLSINPVAQTDPAILQFRDEHVRLYDRNMWKIAHQFVNNTEDVFLQSSQSEQLLQRMSRMISMLHEFAHELFPEDAARTLTKNLGRTLADNLDEIKADVLSRAYIPSMLEINGLEGTKNQWAVATLTQTIMIGKQQTTEIYTRSARMTLQRLLNTGAVVIQEGKFRITDMNNYFSTLQQMAKEIINFYKDPKVNKSQVYKWLFQHQLQESALQVLTA